MGWLCGPGSSSVDLAAPQQASEWMSRDDGFIDGQGQSPVPLGWREPNKSQPLLARVCLQTASYQQKKLSKLLFFPAKRIPPFFFFLLGSSNWEAGPSLHLLCWSMHPVHSAGHRASHTYPACPSLCSPCTSKSKPKGRFASMWMKCCVWAMISCFGLDCASYLSSKQSTDKFSLKAFCANFLFFFFIWKLLRKLFLLLLFVCFHKKWLLVLEFLYEKLSFNRSLFSTVLLVHCQPFHSCNSTIIHDLVDFQPQQLTVRTLNLEFQEWHSATSQV